MYTISGKVIRGAGYGQKMGYPTANLDRRQYLRLSKKPKYGIYAGIAKLQRTARKYKAAIIIGPKDKRGLPKIEAYLLGFTGVLYGEKLVLSFRKYLRPFMSFRNKHVLKGQILKDIQKVHEIINLTE